MLSLFQKAKIIGFGNLHDILDRTIDMNSPSAVRELIREIEDAQQDLNSERARGQATVVGLERQITALQEQDAALDTQVNMLVQAGKDESAKALIQKDLVVERRIDALEDQLAAATQTAAKLKEVSDGVTAKRQSLEAHLEELEQVSQTAKATEQAADAIGRANSIASSVTVDGNIDNLLERQQKRLDVANERLNMAMGTSAPADSVSQDLASVEADARLAELKAKMQQPV